MRGYYSVPGVDTGVRSTANSADVRGNVCVRLAAWREHGRTLGGEAGILVEEEAPPDVAPRFVAIYFPADDLGVLIRHLQAMQAEYETGKHQT